ncbi:MAG: hypothetical protein A4E51_00625 [Methanosaeta sp. PtaU1.Bin055]|nr:MAG: hypothetical protein A4E51_00625 [Methanosaeta sp. PtaU1.Bin055]
MPSPSAGGGLKSFQINGGPGRLRRPDLAGGREAQEHPTVVPDVLLLPDLAAGLRVSPKDLDVVGPPDINRIQPRGDEGDDVPARVGLDIGGVGEIGSALDQIVSGALLPFELGRWIHPRCGQGDGGKGCGGEGAILSGLGAETPVLVLASYKIAHREVEVPGDLVESRRIGRLLLPGGAVLGAGPGAFDVHRFIPRLNGPAIFAPFPRHLRCREVDDLLAGEVV